MCKRMITIGNGNVTYCFCEAQRVIAGYCFGRVPLTWGLDPGFTQVGPPPSATQRFFEAYRLYDCAPGVLGQLELQDVYLTAGLNSRINSKPASGILAIFPELDEALSDLATSPLFWQMNPANLSVPVPAIGTPEYPLWRAWSLLNGIPGSKLATTHKLLHHREPLRCPLLDGETVAFFPTGSAWTMICQELQLYTVEFQELEEWYAALASQQGPWAVFIRRLRMHDILLWTEATGNRVKSARLGGPFVGGAAVGVGNE